MVVVFLAATAGAENAPASPQATVEITFRAIGQAMLPPAWDVLLRPSEAQEEQAVRVSAQAGKPLRMELVPGSSWEMSANLPGFWVPRKTFRVGQAGEETHLSVEVWPLGKVSGRVQVQQKGHAPPQEVLVKTVAAPAILHRPPMPPGVVVCPVDKQGDWSCSLPATKFDLVITASGFTPHYRWGVEVPPAKTLSLGTFPFERGGSMAAWVAVEGGAIDPARCVARLSSLAACGSDAESLLQLDRTAVERPVSKEGFLQITGLAPGNYALEVHQPGLAPARVANLRIDPQAETFLPEPLLLTRPIALEFEIVPPVDERGEPWRAQVLRRAEGDSRPAPLVFDGPANSEGRFTVADQEPGWFRVLVLDAKENRVHSEPERQVDASVRQTIELRRIAVEGFLRLGSKPLSGTLWFGGRSGSTRVKMEADEEGRFAGVLPDRSGSWAVDVDAAEPKFRIRTRAEVQPDRSGRATVAIKLPDTRVFGRIVDPQGRPAERAFLLVASESLRQSVEVDREGTFDLRGLPAGLLALLATDDTAGQSERSIVSAVEGGEVGPIELRLRAMRRLQGTVTSSRGPVAGARVLVRAQPPAVGEGMATTGPEGSFSLEIPANVGAASAVVNAPGYGIQAFPLVPDGKSLSLTLSETAGEVAILLPGAAEFHGDNLRVALFQNGIEVPMTLLRSRGLPDAGSSAEDVPTLRLAGLAPGRYSACLARNLVESTGSLDPASKAVVACDSGQLAAGTTLSLTPRGGD